MQITNNRLNKLPVVWPGQLARHQSEGLGTEGGSDEQASARRTRAIIRGFGKTAGLTPQSNPKPSKY